LIFSHLNINLRDSTTADIYLSDLDPKKGQIPLVITETGNVVLQLSDCYEWLSDRHNERVKQAKSTGKVLDPTLVRAYHGSRTGQAALHRTRTRRHRTRAGYGSNPNREDRGSCPNPPGGQETAVSTR
jgi:hypothetical protein